MRSHLTQKSGSSVPSPKHSNFDSTAQQFLAETETDRILAQQLARTFLDFWSQALKGLNPTQKLSYSEVLANGPGTPEHAALMALLL